MTRRQRSLKEDEIVLEAFAGTGIDREQVLGVDRIACEKPYVMEKQSGLPLSLVT